ncbi:MAG: cytochrome c nitrite reductase small subunit [Fidelibacterota bacterium]|nr:MAG: cytochrome c nitrite reductase small subunit [Candidatus Neomarinimicrobiota bacterium]
MRVLPILLGIFAGLSAFTFFYAKGISYLSDDPQACQNCHIMREQFDAWNRSSHKAVATCNGCHTPKNAIGKYAVKGINGWNHSAAFTVGGFPEPIQIREFNRKIALSNCKRCHQEIISRMVENKNGETSDCFACHGNVGHQERE